MIKCLQMICFVLFLLLTIPEWSESFTSHIKICTPEDEVFTLKRVVWDILQQKLELYNEVYTMLLYQQFCGYWSWFWIIIGPSIFILEERAIYVKSDILTNSMKYLGVRMGGRFENQDVDAVTKINIIEHL